MMKQQASRDVDVDVYSWIMEHRSADPVAVAATVGVDPDEVGRSLERLVAARLVCPGPEATAYFAVSPETAGGRLAAPVEARIRRHQEELAAIQAGLDRFLPVYLQGGVRTATVEVVENVEDVRDQLNRAARRCRAEVLSAQPGGGARQPEAMREALERDRSMLGRGIRMRTIYHHTARFNGPSQAYVAAASALGGEYRTVYDLVGRLIVFDREAAFIQSQKDSRGAVVVREPSTVAYLCGVFDRSWESAKPFSDAADEGLREVSREVDRTILRLLASGLKDETIARRLGMSLRTTRRHISTIMQELGATSRFQAGVSAAERGLL